MPSPAHHDRAAWEKQRLRTATKNTALLGVATTFMALSVGAFKHGLDTGDYRLAALGIFGAVVGLAAFFLYERSAPTPPPEPDPGPPPPFEGRR